MYRKYKQIKWGKYLMALLLLCSVISVCMNEIQRTAGQPGVSTKTLIQESMQEKTVNSLFPIFTFLNSADHETNLLEMIYQQICGQLPLYAYSLREHFTLQTENTGIYEMILQNEGRDEDIDIEGEFEEALRQENEAVLKAMTEEENAQVRPTGEFIEHQEKQQQYDLAQYKDYNHLVGEFYAIDATTMADAELLNLDTFMNAQLTVDRDTKGPQILIFHTHSREDFVDSVPGDPAMTIVGAGEKLASILREKYGFEVLHHTGQYDEKRDYAYSNAAPALEQILAENPSIQVVIDLHRDEVPADRKLLVDMDGRPTAKCMFFNGLSRTKKIGEIDYLNNPYRKDNLAFAFRMQLACNEYYPGFTRKIYLKGYRYNMNYCPKSLLIELGAQTNTVEEIMNACDPLAHAIAMVLNGEA